MFLLIGLGNPGDKYQLTKHNFGFLAIDSIARSYDFSFEGEKFKSAIFTGNVNGKKVIAIKPQSYMNLSGEPVQKIMSFLKIPLQNIIVFHDDIDLNLGRIKVKIGGGNAGHNGLKDIDRAVGSEYMRVRLGVGRPENPDHQVADYVLGKFSGQEMAVVNKTNDKVSKLLPLILEGKTEDFMNQFALL